MPTLEKGTKEAFLFLNKDVVYLGTLLSAGDNATGI